MRRLLLLSILLIGALNTANAQKLNELSLHAYGYAWSTNYEKAVEAFTQLIDESAEVPPDYFLQRGIANFHRAKYESAKTDFQKAVSLHTYVAAIWLARTHSILNEKLYALNNIELYLNNTVRPNVEGIKHDTTFRKLHTTKAWLQLWQSDRLSIDQVVRDEVNWYLKRNDFENAHQVVENAIDGNIENAWLYELHADVYAAQSNWQMAVYELNQAIGIEPKNDFLIKKAQFLAQNNQYSKAVEVLGTILEYDPYNFEVRYQRANQAFVSGNYTLARSDLDICLPYTTSTSVLLLSANTDRMLGSYLSALKSLNPLYEKDSANYDILTARGITYYHTKTYKSASNDLSMSLDLRPDNAETNYFMGLTQKALGDKKLACFYLNRALKYGNTEAKKVIDSFCMP